MQWLHAIDLVDAALSLLTAHQPELYAGVRLRVLRPPDVPSVAPRQVLGPHTMRTAIKQCGLLYSCACLADDCRNVSLDVQQS